MTDPSMNGLKWLLNILHVVHVYLLASQSRKLFVGSRKQKICGEDFGAPLDSTHAEGSVRNVPPFSLLEESVLFARCVFPPFRNAAPSESARDDGNGRCSRRKTSTRQHIATPAVLSSGDSFLFSILKSTAPIIATRHQRNNGQQWRRNRNTVRSYRRCRRLPTSRCYVLTRQICLHQC